MKWMVFLTTSLYCKGILVHGQLGLMRWILCARSIARPADQQTSALPLYRGCSLLPLRYMHSLLTALNLQQMTPAYKMNLFDEDSPGHDFSGEITALTAANTRWHHTIVRLANEQHTEAYNMRVTIDQIISKSSLGVCGFEGGGGVYGAVWYEWFVLVVRILLQYFSTKYTL